jgi:hypothetical protein
MTDDGPYPVGQKVKSTATFADYNGTPTNPTTVVFKYEKPDGTVFSPTVTSLGSGVYTAEVTFDTAGSWWRRWNGTGAIVAAFEAPWFVTPTRF